MAKLSKQKLGWGLFALGAAFVNSSGADSTTPKTVNGSSNNSSYFEFDVTQEHSTPKPYVVCAKEQCPERTVKTIAQKKPVAQAVYKEEVRYDKNRFYFDFGRSKLSENEKENVQLLAANLKGQKQINLRAYADPVGGVMSKKNKQLALARALSVKRVLVESGVNGKFIIKYTPPCCFKQGVTAKSTDAARRELRVVQVD